MNDEENLVEDSVIGTFSENMFGLAITPPARRPFVRLMGLDGKSRSVQTPFYPDSMYGDDVNKGFPVGYYLDNLSVDFGDGLTPDEEDTIYVQIADYSSRPLTETGPDTGVFGDGDFRVTLSIIPVLDDEVEQIITADVDHTLTGTRGRIFLLNETSVMSNKFSTSKFHLTGKFDPEELGSAEVTYFDREIGSLRTTELVETETGSGVYVDDVTEPSVSYEIVYHSAVFGSLDREAMVVLFTNAGQVRTARLLETGDETNAFSNGETGERVYMTPAMPNVPMFQIVSYDPQATGSFQASVDAGGTVADHLLSPGPDGLHRSKPLVGITPDANSGDVPPVVESGYFGFVEMEFLPNENKQSAEKEIAISTGLLETRILRRKGGLIVRGYLPVLNAQDGFFWMNEMHHARTDVDQIREEIKTGLGIPYVRILVLPTVEDLKVALIRASHFFFYGETYAAVEERCPDFEFAGVMLRETLVDGLLQGEYLESITQFLTLDFVFMNSCASGKTANDPDFEVEALVSSLNAEIYVGWQSGVPAERALDFMADLVRNWWRMPFLLEDKMKTHVDDYVLRMEDELSWHLWGVWSLFTNYPYRVVSNCNITNNPFYPPSMCIAPNSSLREWEPTSSDCPQWPVPQ